MFRLLLLGMSLALALTFGVEAQSLSQHSINELDSISDALQAQGNYAAALPYARESYRRAVDSAPDSVTANSANNLAVLHFLMGRYEQAEPLFVEAKNHWKRLLGEEHADYGSVLNNLALIYKETGRYEQAEEVYLQLIAIRKKTLGATHPKYALSLSNLAALYHTLGRYEDAEPLFQEAKTIRAAALGKEHPEYAQSLNNLGILYQKTGRYAEAENYFSEAAAVWRKALGEEHPNYSIVLHNIAILCKDMQRYEQAQLLLEEVVRRDARVLGKTHPSYANTIGSLAGVYSAVGNYAAAEQLFLEAYQIRRAALSNEHPTTAMSLLSLSEFYGEQARLDTAFRYLYAAFDANSLDVDSAHTVSVEKLDQYEYYSKEEAGKALTLFLKLVNLRYQRSQQAADLALRFQLSEAALRINEQTRNDFSTEAYKLRLLAGNTFFVVQGIEAALEIGETKSIADAFRFAEQNKSVLLLDALKGQRARILGDLPDSLALKELELQQKSDKLKKQRIEAKTPEAKAKVTASLNELTLEIDEFRKSLKDKYPKYHQTKYANTNATASEVQALLPPNAALLEYFVAADATYLFCLRANDLQLFRIPQTTDSLKAQIARLRRCLSDYSYISTAAAYRDYLESAHAVYRHFVQPARAALQGVEHLIVIADHQLGHIPFEALLVELPQDQTTPNYANLHYLLRDFRISYHYSASLWRENLAQPEVLGNGRMLALSGDYAVSPLSEAQRDRKQQRLRSMLVPLPSAQQEVEALSAQFAGQFWQGKGATERAFKAQAAEFGIIHLAAHGLVDTENAMLSALALTEDGDTAEDNFLQAWEIAQLKLKTQLVVLSACETGYGKFEQGEGVLSLARAFLYAGVPSLVVSQWEVNDASTADIMRSFYQYLSEGVDKATALQKAKLDYLARMKGMAAHPAYWSAFVQIGDSRPISIEQKGGKWGWWALGALVLVGLAVIAMNRRKAER